MADRVPLPAQPRFPIARRSVRRSVLPTTLPEVLPEVLPAFGVPPTSARSGPVRQPIERPNRAVLLPAGFPLLRRTRLHRTRLERMLGGSAVGHVLLIAGLALLFARQARLPAPQEPPAVEMVYGSSGMVGEPTSADQAGSGKPQTQAPPPTPTDQQPEVNTELPPLPPPVPIPDFSPLPPPEPPKPEQQDRRTARMAPQRAARNSNPFSHPMDLSFSQAGPPRARTGRASGSNSAIDLSLGPLVKDGRLTTPYAIPSVSGVSDDYGNELDSWIRRHLYYPPDAAQRGEDGPSHVHVQIDRAGHVKSVRLVDSSGSWTLDSATEGMFRGRTLPPVPPDMAGDHFDIDLTVNYILEH